MNVSRSHIPRITFQIFVPLPPHFLKVGGHVPRSSYSCAAPWHSYFVRLINIVFQYILYYIK